MPTIQQIETLLEKEPDDVFLNFGLAMAFASAGELEDAIARFDRTITLDSNYVPAYFQKARLLANRGDDEAAKATLGHGLATAKAVGDEHAFGEMTEFLESLG